MGTAIGLRVDFDGAALRRLARKTKNADQSRRLLALAEIYDGRRRSDAARNRDYLLGIATGWLADFERFWVGTFTRVPGVASIKSSIPLPRVKAGLTRTA